jgi:arginyl-tRNA synthetase
VYLALEKKFGEQIRAVLKHLFGIEAASVPVELPPELKFGELSTPIALQLARTLRKSPKAIAQGIVAGHG